MDFEMLFVCWKVRPLAGNSSRKNVICGTLIGSFASDQVRVDPVSARIPPAARGAPECASRRLCFSLPDHSV